MEESKFIYLLNELYKIKEEIEEIIIELEKMKNV